MSHDRDRESRNIDLAVRYHRAVSDGASAEEITRFLAPEMVHEEMPNLLFPDGAVRDLAAMREAAERGQDAMAEQRFEVRNAIAAGDQVALEVEWWGRLAAPYGPYPAGHVLRARIAAFLRIEDGRIVAQRNYDCYEPTAPDAAPDLTR
ncbi:nuclear transport factor 2 family protein [Actinomadura sp. NPDC000600]|uniref:nuclear transport factor 2 family protein n=1 Tax=Actinomadura sp. NPDC000600 TaxID=3154262 RepID=UPI003397AA44